MANQSAHQSEPKVIFNSQVSNENCSKMNQRKSYDNNDNFTGKNDSKPGFFRRAIPIMPKPLAIICCFLNILIPGFGTFIASFTVFCCAKHGYNKNIKSFLINFFAFILQLSSAIIIFGWIWSIKYGLLFIHLSDNTVDDDVIEQELPMYVRRHSSMETSILYQQKSRSSGSALTKVREEEP